MDESLGTQNPPQDTEPAVVEETSTEYLGRWNRLVSTTNWEKGRIISEWRARLIDADAPVQSYSDEAWSRRAGNVSGQHVGRLRRVFERFGEVYDQYAGLYWSHFQAAVEWDDAEMYLEGAVASGWSVSQMRAQRWEALGAPAELKPRDEDVITAELDEDVPPEEPAAPAIGGSMSEVQDVGDGGLRDDVPFDTEPGAEGAVDTAPPPDDETSAADPVRPFEELPSLPDDLADAVETLKLVIVQHKLAGWRDVPCGAILDTLDALKQLALSPTDG